MREEIPKCIIQQNDSIFTNKTHTKNDTQTDMKRTDIKGQTNRRKDRKNRRMGVS